MLRYRAVLSSRREAADLHTGASQCLPGETPLRLARADWSATQFRAIDGDLERVIVVAENAMALDRILIIQESSPHATRDEYHVDNVPRFARDAIARLEPNLGTLPVAGLLGDEEVLPWLQDEDGPGVVAAVLGVDTASPSAAAFGLAAAIAGMASAAEVSQQGADFISNRLERPGVFRSGGLLAISRVGRNIRHTYIPATVARHQLERAIRRISQWCLTQARDWPIPPDLHSLLLDLRREGGGGIDLDSYVEEVDGLERQIADLTNAKEVTILELDEALSHLSDLQRQLRYAQTRLQQLGEYSFVGIDDVDEADSVQPRSCTEALDRARELLPWLEITAAPGPTIHLDGLDQTICLAQKVWMGLRALNDYARCRVEGSHHGGFYEFCTDPPPAVTVYFAKQVAMQEGEQTEQHEVTRLARTFRVPQKVHPSGKIFMAPHLKISQGPLAPRLHFYDDVARSERIYVGYLGKHLPTAG